MNEIKNMSLDYYNKKYNMKKELILLMKLNVIGIWNILKKWFVHILF